MIGDGCGVSRAVKHANNDHMVLCRSVVGGIRSEQLNPQIRR